MQEPHKMVEVLRNLFRGRDDCYGLETKSGPIAVREPLTDELILDHIEGKKRIGVYPLRPNSMVIWACFDIDQDNRGKVERLEMALIDNHFYPYVERSKSKGYHLWIFFDEPIQAKAVRKVLTAILKNVGIDNVEIFPKQDGVTSNNGLGNFVFLPLQGNLSKSGRTVFIDGDFEPYKDQFEHLSKIHRTKTENFFGLIEPEKPEDHGTSNVFDVGRFLKNHNIQYSIKQEPGRTFFLLTCLFVDEHTTPDGRGDSAIVQGVDGKLTYHCFHAHCQTKKWADARSIIEGKTTGGKGRNLAEDLRGWIEMAYGNFSTGQIYNDLNIKTNAEKNFIRVNLHRMVEKGLIERGLSSGAFRRVDRANTIIELKGAISKTLPLKWPGGLEDHVKITRKAIVAVAGTMQAGKTAFLLNTAWINKKLMQTCYFTSEFGKDELIERLETFGYPIEEWDAITFVERSQNFQDGINPDGLNLIDYLEVDEDGNYFKMGIQIRRIYEKLRDGVAVIGLQKKFGSDFGYGGQPTADKPRLYITLEKNILKIVKAKLWKTDRNPNGLTRGFRLAKGTRFTWEPWEYKM